MLNWFAKGVFGLQAVVWVVLAFVGGYADSWVLLGSAAGWLALAFAWPAG